MSDPPPSTSTSTKLGEAPIRVVRAPARGALDGLRKDRKNEKEQVAVAMTTGE